MFRLLSISIALIGLSAAGGFALSISHNVLSEGAKLQRMVAFADPGNIRSDAMARTPSIAQVDRRVASVMPARSVVPSPSPQLIDSASPTAETPTEVELADLSLDDGRASANLAFALPTTLPSERGQVRDLETRKPGPFLTMRPGVPLALAQPSSGRAEKNRRATVVRDPGTPHRIERPSPVPGYFIGVFR